MATNFESSFELLRAAAIDGRTTNIRYRQNELQSLHAALRNDAESICAAIQNDWQSSGANAESEAEYYLAMDAVAHFYEVLDFDKALKDEYMISTGEDNPNRRVGKGVVVIRPTNHTRFYSVICPLAAAIAAGNCVCLELDSTLLNVDGIFKSLLPQALDMDTFTISPKSLDNFEHLDSCFVVDQISRLDFSSPGLNSNTKKRTIAIVDRTANIHEAAEAVVRSRFSFQGTSPYSPDLVIVNEFHKAKFWEACTRKATTYFAIKGSGKKVVSNSVSKTRKDVKEAESKGQLSIFGSSEFMLVDVSDKSCPVLTEKINGCCLVIITSTSMVDALTNFSGKTLLAAYIFAEPKAGKFLSEHIDAEISYVNQIPVHLLVGPAAPTGFRSETTHRHNLEMFSNARPQYMKPSPARLATIETLFNPSMKNHTTTQVRELRKVAVEPLQPTGQKPGHAIGFFEQGIMIGLGLFLAVAVPTASYGAWILGKKGFQAAMSLKRVQ